MADDAVPLIDPSIPPSGTGCVDCLASGGWWFHLRRCTACGNVGCCDSSPSQHARRHAEDTGHLIVATFEPDEEWFFDFADGEFLDGPSLVPPLHHPREQPAPGPAGRVPADWARHLH